MGAVKSRPADFAPARHREPWWPWLLALLVAIAIGVFVVTPAMAPEPLDQAPAPASYPTAIGCWP
jgi:hypothetical protein